MMTREGLTNIVNFMTFRVGVALGCGQIDDIVKMLNFFKIFSTPGHKAY